MLAFPRLSRTAMSLLCHLPTVVRRLELLIQGLKITRSWKSKRREQEVTPCFEGSLQEHECLEMSERDHVKTKRDLNETIHIQKRWQIADCILL